MKSSDYRKIKKYHLECLTPDQQERALENMKYWDKKRWIRRLINSLFLVIVVVLFLDVVGEIKLPDVVVLMLKILGIAYLIRVAYSFRPRHRY